SGQIITAKYDGTNFQILVPGSSTSGSSSPLTWGSSVSVWGATFFPSNETFSGFKHLRIRGVLKRTATSNGLEIALSPDGSKCYRFAAQSDGNLVWYYNSNSSTSSVMTASGTSGTNLAG